MGEAVSKHLISAMQGDGMLTHVQQSKLCFQEITSHYNGIGDW